MRNALLAFALIVFVINILNVDYDQFLDWSVNGRHFLNGGIALGLLVKFGHRSTREELAS